MNKKKEVLLIVFAIILLLTAVSYISSCSEDEENTDAGKISDVASTGDVIAKSDAVTSEDSESNDPCAGKEVQDPCPGGFCIDKEGGGLECAKSCTKVGIDPACETGYACYPYENIKVCQKSGSKKEGESCSIKNECEAGMICLSDGTDSLCYRICHQSSDCIKGTCNKLQNEEYGICE